MKTTKFKYQTVPDFITQGFAAQYIFPVATKICVGNGLDIGCNRPEWGFPGAQLIDLIFDDPYDAFNLPDNKEGWDYIFSSHCLEHLPNYESAVKIWYNALRPGGILFLYLPHPDCVYWQPNEMPNQRHLHTFTPKTINDLFEHIGFKNIFKSESDAAYSFTVYGEKQ